MINYDLLTLRNKGYISQDLQLKIKESKILIAGCGIGSTIAECFLRAGFINLTLVDFDIVESHNLNRQIYTSEDINESKVNALQKRLLAIFPDSNISIFNSPISKDNIKSLVKNCDIVMDTIDFLDLSAIIGLHDEARIQKKPLISAVSAGFGAVAMFFTGNEKVTGMRKLMNLPNTGSVNHLSYAFHLKELLNKFRLTLDESIIEAMNDTLTKMENKIPCPAPHLSIGSFSSGALACSIAIKHLEGYEIKKYPDNVFILNFNNLILKR